MSEIILRVGDTSVLDFTIKKDEQPLDLKDFLVLFTVKKPFFGSVGINNPNDNQAIIAKNSDIDKDGGIEKYGSGSIRVILGSLDTKNILDGQYDYDLQLSKPGKQDSVLTVDTGVITFTKEITRRTEAL